MKHGKRNTLRRYSLFLIAVSLIAALAGGVSYARYRSDFLTTSFWFTSALTECIHVRGEVTGEDADEVMAGVWPELPAAWSYHGSEATLSFSVSNGYSGEEYSDRSQAATVELVAGLSIEAPEHLTVTLGVTDMSGSHTQYEGVARQITEGSRYYATYGEGWLYQFFEEDGNELLLPLEGGSLQYWNCYLTVNGNINASLLSLELSGTYLDTE